MITSIEPIESNAYRALFWGAFGVFFLFVPSVIIAIIILFFLSPIQFKKIDAGLICFFLAIFMASLASAFDKINNTGDISRYILTFELLNTGALLSPNNDSLYIYFYPSWYALNMIIKDLGLPFKYVTFICVFIGYYTSFLVVKNIVDKKKEFFVLIIFISLFYSLSIIFSSYRTFTALGCICLGLLLLSKGRLSAFFLIALGLGFHPIGFVPLIVYFISDYIKPSRAMLLTSISLGFFVKPIIIAFSVVFLSNIPFLSSKVESYISGDWADYRFHEVGEYLTFFQLCTFSIALISLFIVVSKYHYRLILSDRFIKFSLVFFCFSLLFFSFRTIYIRLLLSGVMFYLPIIFFLFKVKLSSNRVFLTMLLLLSLDVRTLTFFTNESYQIGASFPLNIFEPHIINLLIEN